MSTSSHCGTFVSSLSFAVSSTFHFGPPVRFSTDALPDYEELRNKYEIWYLGGGMPSREEFIALNENQLKDFFGNISSLELKHRRRLQQLWKQENGWLGYH